MKINQPVTNVETLLPEGEFIYSSTDLKGVIVEANEAFVRISNFTRDEMIGQSHNMVRHPAMLSTLAYSPCEPYGKRVKWRSLSH